MKTRRRMGRVIAARLVIKLSGDDYDRWAAFAKQQRLTLEQLVAQGVELAIARGSTR